LPEKLTHILLIWRHQDMQVLVEGLAADLGAREGGEGEEAAEEETEPQAEDAVGGAQEQGLPRHNLAAPSLMPLASRTARSTIFNFLHSLRLNC
jgi:hypothetical protein